MMKKTIYIFIATIISLSSYANLEVYFMYSTFNSPDGPYIETYLSTIGNTAVFAKNENGNFQSQVEITMIFKKADSIVAINKYNLSSPEITDTSVAKPNFIDLQRISLENGIYNYSMIIKDLNAESKGYEFNDIIQIDFNSTSLQFSGIQLVESITPAITESMLTKNGFDFAPYISNFYPTNMNKLSFYTEIYNSDKTINDDFIIRYYIENFQTGSEIESYSRFKKLSSSSIVPLSGDINIETLKSGNYNLVVEIKNRDNESLLKSKYFFQRSNPKAGSNENLEALIQDMDIATSFAGDMTNKDSLAEYISCLRPIANQNEHNFIDYQIEHSSLETLQNYFMQFWLSRNNVNPGEIWRQYKEQVDFIDISYRTPINRGYETDRGRVYLQYGAPNDMYVSKHEPSAYPYEIWHYYRVLDENNKKFIFYNPNIAGKEYELLHSNLTGEVRTPNWERVLSKRNNSLYDQDAMNADDAWGSRAGEEFNR